MPMYPPTNILEKAHKFSNSLRLRDDAHMELIALLKECYSSGWTVGWEGGWDGREEEFKEHLGRG